MAYTISTNIGTRDLQNLTIYLHNGTLELFVEKGRFFLTKPKWNPKYVVICKPIVGKRAWNMCCYKGAHADKADINYSMLDFESVKEYDNVDEHIFGFTLKFVEPTKTPLQFRCDTKESRNIWIKHIRTAIQESHKDSGYSSDTDRQSKKYETIDDVDNDIYDKLHITDFRSNASCEEKHGAVMEDKQRNFDAHVKEACLHPVQEIDREPRKDGHSTKSHQKCKPKKELYAQKYSPYQGAYSSDPAVVETGHIYENLVKDSESSSINTKVQEQEQLGSIQGEWDRCLEREDIELMTYLINRNYLPDREQLKKACRAFSRSSDIICHITDKICETIKRRNDNKVKCVWAAYEPHNENYIVFVIVTKESNTDLDFKPEYDVRYRKDGDFSSESKEVILKESDGDLYPDEREINNIQQCIKKHTSKLMSEHSNLTIISASLLKCKGYGTNNCIKERRACIVLHVHIKGLIPLKESMFPKSLDGVDVDVREGCFKTHSRKGPHEKHQNVKSGCGIKAKEQEGCGTLGGFIDHPQYGLCALSCAHVFTGNMKITDDLRHQYNEEVVECIQPCFELDDIDGSRFGELKLVVIRKGSDGDTCNSVGLVYAIIAIDKNREPSSGCFPFIEPEMLIAAGFRDQSCMTFQTGEVVDYKGLLSRSRSNVVKYGSTTFLTCGALAWLTPTVSFRNKETGFYLMNQMQINITRTGTTQTFSAGGDSGALVFHVDDENKLTAVALLIGGDIDLGFSAATPICDILADLNVKKLKRLPSSHESENGTFSSVLHTSQHYPDDKNRVTD